MSKELPPSRVAEQFVVRFPDGMRGRIAEAAKANNRSMNAEIVARLEESFAGRASDSTNWQAILQATSLYNKVAMLDMQIQMVKLRLQSLAERHAALGAETALLAKQAKTDHDFELAEAKLQAMRTTEDDMDAVGIELEKIVEERTVVLDQITQLREAITGMQRSASTDLSQN